MFASAVDNILQRKRKSSDKRIKDVRAKIVFQIFVTVRSREKQSRKKPCPHLRTVRRLCLSLFLLKPTLFRSIIPNKLKLYDLYFYT